MKHKLVYFYKTGKQVQLTAFVFEQRDNIVDFNDDRTLGMVATK